MKVIDYPYLKDKEFLKYFDNLRNKEQFVKIVALTWQDEVPIAEIQGRAVSGSININGSSNMRRTANIGVVADEEIYNILNVRNLISINKKVEIEVGFTNMTDKYREYPIIWFPQGVYVIKEGSVTHNNSGINISLQLSDKMCLLNGQCGGTLSATTTFDKIISIDKDDNWTEEYIALYLIIQRIVHEFGGEDLNRIIINDVPDRVKKVMRWMGEQDAVLYSRGESKSYVLKLDSDNDETESLTKIKTFTYGDDIGYIYSDFYSPNEISGNAGDAITSVLDKIKNMLGNYEYFYDIYGNFIFQEIRNYLNTTQASFDLETGINVDEYLINRTKGKSVYQFNDGNLITSYSNNPQFNNIKNDYIIWGQRKDAIDEKNGTPIHYHLAIDTKPKVGNEYAVVMKKANVSADSTLMGAEPVELIKLSSLDELAGKNEFDSRLWYYVEGDNKYFYRYNKNYGFVRYPVKSPDAPRMVKTTDWREELYYQSIRARNRNQYNFYYEEMAAFWPQIFNAAAVETGDVASNGFPLWKGEYREEDERMLNFYIDFIDTNGSISNFCIDAIGRRTKVVTDTSINCLFAPEIPNFVIIETEDGNESAQTAELREECEKKGQPYIQVKPSLYAAIAVGGVFNPAYDYIRSLLYQFTSYNENISLSVIPIYHLEPNTRITVNNKDVSISGDYMIKTISLPLDINGTMNLSCTKALERI